MPGPTSLLLSDHPVVTKWHRGTTRLARTTAQPTICWEMRTASMTSTMVSNRIC